MFRKKKFFFFLSRLFKNLIAFKCMYTSYHVVNRGRFRSPTSSYWRKRSCHHLLLPIAARSCIGRRRQKASNSCQRTSTSRKPSSKKAQPVAAHKPYTLCASPPVCAKQESLRRRLWPSRSPIWTNGARFSWTGSAK